MKTIAISFLFLLLSVISCRAQLTIGDCQRKAQANYPLIRRYNLIEKTKEYNLKNVSNGYFPQLVFSAQATYQSDVTKIPLDLDAIGLTGVEIPVLSQDQYKTEVALTQVVWDGGMIRSQRKALRTQAEVDKRNLDVSIYTLNDRVNQLYFGILLTDARLKQNRILQKELQRHCREVTSYINNGIANQSDLDALRVDELKARQDEAQLVYTRRAYTVMLSKFIGQEISDSTVFVRPDAVRPLSVENNRPELALYESQINNLLAQDYHVTAGLMPRISLFATGGYGKPGLDMFEDRFKAYYIAGVRLSWNISNFWTQKNDHRKIRTDIQSVKTQRETFIFNTAIDVAQSDAGIDRYVEQLRYDDEIIALRRSVRQASEIKMANGTLSGTDLTRDIHAEQAAILDKMQHELEMLLAIYKRKYITNE